MKNEYKLGEVVYTIHVAAWDSNKLDFKNLRFIILRHIITGIEHRIRGTLETIYELDEGLKKSINEIYQTENLAKAALLKEIDRLFHSTEIKWRCPSNEGYEY